MNIKQEYVTGEIYLAMDSFLVEAKDQDGNERSLERLNKDRHLFVEKINSIIAQLIKEERKAIGENLIKLVNDQGNDTEIAVNDVLRYVDHLITNQEIS